MIGEKTAEGAASAVCTHAMAIEHRKSVLFQ